MNSQAWWQTANEAELRQIRRWALLWYCGATTMRDSRRAQYLLKNCNFNLNRICKTTKFTL